VKEKVCQKKIDLEHFFGERQKVLSMWPTGKEVDLKEAIEYQRNLSESRNFGKVVEKLDREGRTVVYTRAGTPILEDEIELNRALVASGLPLIPVTTDSYTRLCQFDKAERGLQESLRARRPMLNGFPIVNYGVRKTRNMTESCEAAYNPRFANIDGRLIAEIAFASGMTGVLADPFLSFGNYEKKTTLAECIANYQYIHRLIGYYAEKGVLITVDLDSWLSHGPFPSSVSIATLVAASLIAAEQGVKSIVPSFQFEGNLLQDIAGARLTRRLVNEYLDKLGYGDVVVPGLFVAQNPIFPCPQDMSYSFSYLTYTAMVAALAEAATVTVKTIDEAAGIPTKETHSISYRSANWMLNVVRKQGIKLQDKQLELEEKIAEMEVRAILNKVMELGNGDVVVGFIRAVDRGIVDSPMSGNIHVKSQVLGIRDRQGATRYLDFGNLPIPEEAKTFHREKIKEREFAEHRKMNYEVVIEDFWALSQGQIVGSETLLGL
jgi:methylaspartate mutase epsilon subunit